MTSCRRGRWASAASTWRALPTWSACSTGSSSTRVTTSMTINAPAAMIFAMYLVVAERQGADWARLSGNAAERHPQGVHRAEGVHLSAPPVDAARHRRVRVLRGSRGRGGTPFRSAGYHIREAGATAVQELAFTLRDGIEYVQYGVDAGLDVDRFVPRISFFFNAHNRFFEEVAKYRAATQAVGARHARALRRQARAFLEAAVSRPDRRCVADRAAAVQQCGADRAAGAGCSAGRCELVAHQRARRGAGAAHPRGGAAGPAYAAGDRARERSAGRRWIRSADPVSSNR